MWIPEWNAGKRWCSGPSASGRGGHGSGRGQVLRVVRNGQGREISPYRCTFQVMCDVATSPPSFLPQRPVPARVVGASMDYDYSFDSPRSPVFVEGGGASSTGWPLHRMTLQPWRIYVTAATNAQGASRQARRLLCP